MYFLPPFLSTLCISSTSSFFFFFLFLFFSPTPFCLYFFILASFACICPPHTPLGLPPVHSSLSKPAGSPPHCLRSFFPLTLSSLLSSFTLFCNFLQSRLSSEWLEGHKRSRKQLVIAFAQDLRLWCPGPRLGLPGTVSAVLMCSWAIPR